VVAVPGIPQVDRSTPKRKSQQQSRRGGPTKINKEVIQTVTGSSDLSVVGSQLDPAC